MSGQHRRRIIKLGGSLLGLDDLPTRFARWQTGSPADHDLLVVGGGPLVDEVRAYATRFGINDGAAHWRSLECMTIHAKMIAETMDCPLLSVAIPPDPRDQTLPPLAVLDCQALLEATEPSADLPLPHDWTVTSDSIAARVAELFEAELVLLKSKSCEASSWCAASTAGYVDEFFPRATRNLTAVSAVNLNDPKFATTRLPLATDGNA